MASFFDKLKKGMGIEESELKEEVKKPEEKPRKIKKAAVMAKNKKNAEQVQELKIETPEAPEKETEIAKPAEPPLAEIPQPKVIQNLKNIKEEGEGGNKEKKQWAEEIEESAGQLAIDVYQTEKDLVIQSAIAGVGIDKLDISMERDVITIKGIRRKPFEEEGDYFVQECYWGPFARQVIMPAEVDPDKAEASMKEGILTIRIPRILREKKRTIKVKI